MDALDFGKFFSFDGRVGRKTFWQSTLLMLIPYLVIYVPLFVMGGSDALQLAVLAVAVVVYLAVAVAGLANTVKRLHDRGKSGWFYFVGLIPFVGPIWLIVEVGFKEGEQGENQYGAPNSGSPFGSEAPAASYGI